MPYQLFYGNPFTPGGAGALFDAAAEAEQFARDVQNTRLAQQNRQLALEEARFVANQDIARLELKQREEERRALADRWKSEQDRLKQQQAFNEQLHRDQLAQREKEFAAVQMAKAAELVQAGGEKADQDSPVKDGYVRVELANGLYDMPKQPDQFLNNLKAKGFVEYDPENPAHQPKKNPKDPNDLGYDPERKVVLDGPKGTKWIGDSPDFLERQQAQLKAQETIRKERNADYEQKSAAMMRNLETENENIQKLFERQQQNNDKLQAQIKEIEASATTDQKKKRVAEEVDALKSRMTKTEDLENKLALNRAQRTWWANHKSGTDQAEDVPDWVDPNYSGKLYKDFDANRLEQDSPTVYNTFNTIGREKENDLFKVWQKDGQWYVDLQDGARADPKVQRVWKEFDEAGKEFQNSQDPGRYNTYMWKLKKLEPKMKELYARYKVDLPAAK